jgi:hypothetical protein
MHSVSSISSVEKMGRLGGNFSVVQFYNFFDWAGIENEYVQNFLTGFHFQIFVHQNQDFFDLLNFGRSK